MPSNGNHGGYFQADAGVGHHRLEEEQVQQLDVADGVFVVTGGGNGIGREVVRQLVRGGAHVAAVDLRPDALDDLARGTTGPGALTVHAVDVTDLEAVRRLAATVLAEHGHIDGLLNVAGIIHRFARVQDLTVAEIDRVLTVNFRGVVHTCTTFLPHLLERGRAGVVNVGSMGGLVPFPGQSAYGASKAAVTLFTEALRSELAGTGVGVTIAHPGAVATGIADNSGAALPGAGGGRTPRMTTPTDAAAQIVRGLRAGTPRVLIGRDVRLVSRLARLAPVRTAGLVAGRLNSLLD
jgi:NAD(P)-dependent dehydrogenase (short-subunit alcohol dehydrogenase family)|nr:SDR family oxidoreductase [Cellulomonas hominis]